MVIALDGREFRVVEKDGGTVVIARRRGARHWRVATDRLALSVLAGSRCPIISD